MKKRMFFIGNNAGLPGVNNDYLNYSTFFKSNIGGAWLNSEIISLMQPTLIELRNQIEELKKMQLDFIIVVYSGHGGQERETILEINAKGETIYESELKNIATRQILVYDCCRVVSTIQLSEGYDQRMEKSASVDSRIRALYETRIMQSIPQQLCLYACSIGETASDTSDGGLYSKYLLLSARSVTTEYMTVGQAHQSAKQLTTAKRKEQNPEASLIRCMSHQELILSINPTLKK
jgi:hypothetical protein